MKTTALLLLICTALPASAQNPRARDLGIPFEGTPGALNAITDVAGVEVGHATLVRGSGQVVIGEGPVRTGVTAVWPRGREMPDPVYAAWFSLNGDGEMTGTTWVRDSGIMEGPVMITNTLSVGVVHHAVIRWGVARTVERGGGAWLASHFRLSPRRGTGRSTTSVASTSPRPTPSRRWKRRAEGRSPKGMSAAAPA